MGHLEICDSLHCFLSGVVAVYAFRIYDAVINGAFLANHSRVDHSSYKQDFIVALS